jgi:pimeloyl-ACP methyl ester carboxylesterase
MPIFVVTAMSACVPHKLYNDLPEQYLQQVTVDQEDAVPAHLTVIEFDDHGVLWKRDQLEDTIELIHDANRAAEDGTLVIVYIHGWQNNANPKDANGSLAQFRNSVRANAARNPADRPFAADRIIGVFLGWRGDSSDVPVQEQLTFWDRRHAGERIASVHMQETLLRIMRATKERPGSKCFVVGHSMGGMIVGQTMAPILTTLLLSQDGDGTPLPVDLVLLQNPALDALASWQTIDLLKRFDAKLLLRTTSGETEPANGPLIASITSEADKATSQAYPFGRTIASFGTSFRRDHAPGEPSQHHLATHALGHVDYLTSHRAFLRDGEVIIERITDAFNDTPFWVIQVSRDISKDHGDVNNPVYGRMIEQLINLNQVYRTDIEAWLSKRGTACSADTGDLAEMTDTSHE